MQQFINASHWFKPVSLSKKDKEEECFFENYFQSKKDCEAFPFVIFTDHVPDGNELNDILGMRSAYNEYIKPVIVAIKKRVSDCTACWNLLAQGIDDVVEWTEREEMVTYLESKYQRYHIIKDTVESELVTENLIGTSVVWKKFLSELIETTLFSQASVLLTGESGTGKELISRLIHTLDKRPDKKKLIVVDCTTIVAELSGSELFGHERGSYTNAISSREGAVALANGGTLFLDEIGELPLNLQAELLRVLQEGTYKKVGSNSWQKTSFRLVCATNRNLQDEVEKGSFRQDLFFRISDSQFHVPSLTERREDIPALASHFLSMLFDEKKCPQLDRAVTEYLVNRHYPGNIRELRQLVQRLALKHTDHNKITIGEVPVSDRIQLNGICQTENNHDGIETLIRKALLTGQDWWKLKDKISETAIQVALDLENNNKQKAAERLGVDVRTVQQYVKRKG